MAAEQRPPAGVAASVAGMIIGIVLCLALTITVFPDNLLMYIVSDSGANNRPCHQEETTEISRHRGKKSLSYEKSL